MRASIWSTICAWGCAAAAALPLVAAAAEPAPAPGSDSKPIQGIKRGADAAGRSIDRADQSARRGIASGSERASAGPRRVGEALGRKLGTGGRPAPPPVGPQGTAP